MTDRSSRPAAVVRVVRDYPIISSYLALLAIYFLAVLIFWGGW